MLHALIADCAKISSCEVLTTLDPRIELTESGCEILPVNNTKSYVQWLQEYADHADLVWIIAPESGEALASIVAGLRSKNCLLLNCSEEAIRATGDKRICSELMELFGLPVIPHIALEELTDYGNAVVVKPRFGVGSEDLRICANGSEALKYIEEPQKWVVQPFIEGEHRSLCLLCNQGQAQVLACNIQQFVDFPEPKLSKCIVNAYPSSAELDSLAMRIAKSFPGLNGYVGVDYIETSQGEVLVEINPRLTTSYIGLANALNQNPAQLCIDAITTDILPQAVENTGLVTEVVLV